MPATPRNLKFKSAYYQYTGQTGTLEVSTNGGNTWTNLITITTSAVAERTVDMTAYANQTIVLRWKFVSPSWAYYWQIDDVRTETIPVAPAAVLVRGLRGNRSSDGVDADRDHGRQLEDERHLGPDAQPGLGGTGNAAGCDSDKSGSAAYDCSLITSAFNVTSLTTPTLSLKVNYNDLTADRVRDFFDITHQRRWHDVRPASDSTTMCD